MTFKKTLKHSILLTALFTAVPAVAGGPLVVDGADGHTPVRYQNPAITLNVEAGNLGALSNAAANFLLQDAFDLWNQVSTSSVQLSIDTTALNFDINISNFDSYLPSVDNSVLNAQDNLNPVVYDANGEIIDAYFGTGQSDFTVGFAASVFTQGTGYYDEGYAVINGKDLGLSITSFKLLIAHEIGHFLGLDHSQLNINNTETDFGFPAVCTTSNPDAYPIMYPFVCRNSSTLHADDISILSTLYPASSMSSSYGILQGRFLDANNLPILGANIWVENITTGNSYSVASDFLEQGTGFYRIYLPAGQYTLHANSINTIFNGASGIGPYAETILDFSFTNPHPITPVTYQGTTAGSNEVITISNSQTQTVDFSITGTTATADNITQNDSIADLFGGFSPLFLLVLAGIPVVRRLRH